MENKDICTFPDCGQSIDNVTLVGFGPGNTPQSVPVSRLAKAGELDDTQVLVLSLKTALWTGDVEYTYNMYENAAAGYDSEYGRLVDFGEIPAGVTSITIKFSQYVCSGMYQFKVPENSSLESVSVVLDDDDETPLMVAKDSVPESYEAGHVYQISVMYKNVVFGDFESATADTTDTLDNTDTDNVTDDTDGTETEGGAV